MGTAGQSITLANSIIGVGILAMPFCFQQCGVLLASLILLFMGLVSRLCCYFLLKSALLARRRNFEFLAFHVFGPAGKLAVEVGIIGFLMGTCIAYFVVVGDLGPQIIAKLFNINQSDILRTSIMVLVSLLCVLPLGLLRNVDSLSNVSAATIGFYFCLVMKVIAEAASQMLTAEWEAHMELWKPSGVLQCVPIFSMALFCQTQLFEIFESLPTLSLEKMNLVTKNAINICTSVYFTLGVFGYIAFCSQQISGNILMSLSPTMASDVIKLGFVMSLAFSFPLIIFPCRASLYSLLYKKVHSTHHDHIINHSIPESSFRCITVAIIAVTLFISLLIPNIELVLGLVGSTIGVMICIIFPAACFINVTFKNTNERVLAKGVLVLGLIIMVLGTYANLQAAESQIDKYDERYITPEKIDKMVEEFFQKMDKSDDGVMVKPIDKNDVKIDDSVIKDSMALPPNPVPPEPKKDSMVLPPNPVPPESNEKPAEKEEAKHKTFKILNDSKNDKVSDTHPKNLKKNIDAQLSNGDGNKINTEKSKETEKQEANEDKKEIEKKQQKLIETIKQHGEEQKELLKEQKEILDEILKTKKEMAQKNEAESNEAKKIAVESIKKIADMAIQSLAGVSEKPKKLEDNKNIGKLADEAVQEIAKKAVETIEAIKEINEKAEEKLVPNSAPSASPNMQHAIPNAQNVPQNVPLPVQNILAQNVPEPQNILQAGSNVPQPAQNVPQSVQNALINPELVQHDKLRAQNAQPLQNSQHPAQNVAKPSENVQQPAQNVQQPQNVQQAAQNIPQPSLNVPQPQNIQPAVQNAPLSAQYVQSGQSAVNIQQQQNVQHPANNVEQAAPNLPVVAPQVPNIPPPAQNEQQPPQIIQRAQNIPQPIQNAPQPIQNGQNVVQNIHNGQNSLRNVQNSQPLQNEAQPAQNAPQAAQVPNEQAPNNPMPANVQANVAQFVSNNVANQPPQNKNQQAQNNEKKEHSHSPDEPKSYRQGEDAQKQDNSNVNNVPIVDNNQNPIKETKLNDHVNNANEVKSRQKREVVDCTEKSTLKPEDKAICERFINVPQYKVNDKVDFPKVDLNNVELPRSLPLDANMIHIGRSLKSYDDNENR